MVHEIIMFYHLRGLNVVGWVDKSLDSWIWAYVCKARENKYNTYGATLFYVFIWLIQWFGSDKTRNIKAGVDKYFFLAKAEPPCPWGAGENLIQDTYSATSFTVRLQLMLLKPHSTLLAVKTKHMGRPLYSTSSPQKQFLYAFVEYHTIHQP